MPVSGIVLVVWWFCFCFLSGFSEGVLDECCISYWHAWLCVHGGMLAAVQSRVKGRSGEKILGIYRSGEGGGKLFLVF